MKTQDNNLHPSEELAPLFASYREEQPLLSSLEIDRLLSQRDMLSNQSLKTKTVRRIIMSTIGIAGLGVLLYIGANGGLQKPAPHVTAGPALQSARSKQEVPLASLKSISATLAKTEHVAITDTRGPWSASGEQYYFDLTEEQLAKIGVAVTKDDSVRCYYYTSDNKVEAWEMSAHSVGGGNSVSPQSMQVPKFFPVLATFDNGQGVAYHIEEGKTKEWGMVGSNEMMEKIHEWLKRPAVPGYYALGFNSVSRTDDDHVEHDTVKIQIAKDFPPRLWPLMRQHIGKLSDSVVDAIMQLAHYYDGSAQAKPTIAWPKTLTITVDTITVKDLNEKIDHEENSTVIQRLHSIMAHINDLVPVIVHTHGEGKDFILWYKPSAELFAMLPDSQVRLFNEYQANGAQCLNTPSGITNIAELTYCLEEAQEVQIQIQNLTGKVLKIIYQYGVAGDNIVRINTSSLSSGMYLVTVKERNGDQRTRRIWVENARPKDDYPIDKDAMNPDVEYVEPAISAFSNPIGDSQQLSFSAYTLSDSELAKIGIESNDSNAGYYYKAFPNSFITFDRFGRKGGWHNLILDSRKIYNIGTPNFRPIFITDGIGTKRSFAPDGVFNIGDNIKDLDSAMKKAYREIDKLVPIILPKSIHHGLSSREDFIFWYRPTPDFLAILPDSIRNHVLAQTTRDGSKPHYALSINAMRGAIESADIYPNPSKGRLSVHLTLHAPRTLTFTLRNLLGRAVTDVVQAHLGEVAEQQLDFSHIAEGIYILDIASDAGERFIQRVVIQR